MCSFCRQRVKEDGQGMSSHTLNEGTLAKSSSQIASHCRAKPVHTFIVSAVSEHSVDRTNERMKSTRHHRLVHRDGHPGLLGIHAHSCCMPQSLCRHSYITRFSR